MPKKFRVVRRMFKRKKSLMRRIFNWKTNLIIAGCLAGAFALMLIISMVMTVVSSFFPMKEAEDKMSGGMQNVGLTEEVLALSPLIYAAAEKNGIVDYYNILLAICMQESCGRGNNPFQVNDVYDVDTSVKKGAEIFAMHLKAANCKDINDLNNLKRALQAYNMGGGFINYNNRVSGGQFSAADAKGFSDKMKLEYGWDVYGDPSYVEHVMRWYVYGTSNSQIINVAAKEIGNHGGQKFWSWYGFGGRVEWCACFVAWCAYQCGYIQQGIMPMTAVAWSGWYIDRGQWMPGGGTPQPGYIIFFDWDVSGDTDHVGFVERVEDGVVYTIEGNNDDQVLRTSYTIDYYGIKGYGLPQYPNGSTAGASSKTLTAIGMESPVVIGMVFPMFEAILLRRTHKNRKERRMKA